MERLNPTTSRALPTARPSLADQVASLPGFGRLPEARREQLQRLLTTPREANVVAGFGQDVVRRLSNNPTFLGLSAEQQGAVLGLVFEGTWLPGTTADLITGLEKTGTATLGEITACEPYRFSGAKTDQLALHRTVTIDGREIELVYPQDQGALYRAKHTPQSVALALQLMAPSLRAKINRVVISPLPFPGDKQKEVHEKYVASGDRALLAKMLARLEPVFGDGARQDDSLRRMLHHAFGLRLDPPRGGGGSGGALAAAWRDPEHPGTLELYPLPGTWATS
ncbi:MAG: hypothetical protein IPJ65_42210 [Archangiaceae bacterium]|nr:hypothetical protein [Archangiaceae bacterium]